MSYLQLFFLGRTGMERKCVKECQIPMCYSRGFLYSQDSLMKWFQLVNYYTVRSREKLVFWFSFPFPISHSQQVVLIKN